MEGQSAKKNVGRKSSQLKVLCHGPKRRILSTDYGSRYWQAGFPTTQRIFRHAKRYSEDRNLTTHVFAEPPIGQLQQQYSTNKL